LVNYLILGVMGVALSAAIYARLYGRRVKRPIQHDGKVGISPTSKALMSLYKTTPDYSSAIGVVLEQAKRSLGGEIPHSGSKEELKYLISISESTLKRKGNASTFKEIGSLYSRLNLGGARRR